MPGRLEPLRGDNPDSIIAGRFVVERPVGAGSAGTVFRARDLHSGSTVALKLYRVPTASRPDRSAHEARALASVEHEAFVRYIAHGRTRRGEPYLAMEWAEGETLAARLAGRGLTPLESLRLARRLSQGLAALHARGFVHRDLKPGNIVLERGRVDVARIVDLGVARDMSLALPAAGEGTYVGTPRYMAPEQIRAPEHAGPASDVFSLGCVLFECLCGTPAFGASEVFAVLAQILFEPAPSPRSLRSELPVELERLLASLLSRTPEARPVPGPRLDQQLTAAMTGVCALSLLRLGPPPAAALVFGGLVTESSAIRLAAS